jgi:hypothetical protein
MPVCFGVIQVPQQRMNTMNQPSRQPELPLTNETVLEALPEEVIGECRQLIAQMLREVVHAEKEVRDEQ